MKRYVLIGGSIATEGAIEGILSVTKNADITVICGEKRPLYSRPLISYVLEKKTQDKGLYFRGKDYYEKYKNSEDAEFAKHCTAIKNAESGKARLLKEIEDRKNGLDPEAETDSDPEDE